MKIKPLSLFFTTVTTIIIIIFLIPFQRQIFFTTLSTVAQVKINSLNFFSYIKVKEDIKKICSEFEKKYSVNRKSSYIFKLNQEKQLNNPSEDFQEIIQRAVQMSKKTDGHFDITTQPLLRLWGFDNQKYKLPEKNQIKNKLQEVGYKNIKITENTVKLKNNARINLGGFAKGTLVDLIFEYLNQMNLNEFIIDLGGDLRVFSKDENRIFKIGIKHPVEPGIIKVIELNSGEATATTGDYERSFQVEGQKYHHVLSPFTGYPAGKFNSVTVVAKKAERADFLSTALFLTGYEWTVEKKDVLSFSEIYFINNEYEEKIKIISK
ncbi:MAG: FAD:protein FMN transferase [Candidatus Muiribacteriota bacterium]